MNWLARPFGGLVQSFSIVPPRLLTDLGTVGDGPLAGNEESLTTFSDAVVINQLRHAGRSADRMQRVPFDVRDEALSGLRDWWADRIDKIRLQQMIQKDIKMPECRCLLANLLQNQEQRAIRLITDQY